MRIPIALALLAACSGSASREKPPSPQTPSDAGVAAVPPVDASTAPVVTAAADREFWKKGDAACPDGGKLVGRPTRNVYCVAAGSGELHGPYASFSEKGELLQLTMYAHGKREGLTITWSPEGVKLYEGTTRQNNQHGLSTRYHPNGKKAYEGSYRDGRPDGAFRAWDESGKELGTFTMKNGTGTLTEWHSNGQKAWQQPMENGQAHGTVVHWYPNGAKQSEARFSRGVPVGATTSWGDRGQVIVKGQFAGGEQDGDWTFHDPSGAIVRVDRYSAGVPVATIDYQDGVPLGRPVPAQGACATDDGVAESYRKQSGKELGKEHRCLHRAPHFPGLVLVGGFAHDRGCIQTGVLLDCKLVAKVEPKKMMERAGWAIARPPAREKIAMDYLREVQLAWEGSLADEPDRPVMTHEKDGGVTITAWIAEPPGMTPEITRHLTEHRFAASGALSSKVLRSQTK